MTTIYMRQWREFHKHPCIKCGNPCSYNAKTCHDCNHKRAQLRGKDHHCWKPNNLRINSYGYVRIHKDDNSGEIYEHRLIVAKSINRPLKITETVHHLNGIKTDNRIENLVILDRSKHFPQSVLLIKELRKRIRELESQKRLC